MRAPSVAVVALGLVLAACGYRENGASCWSDDQCASNNCGWGGRCEAGLLELLASLAESDPPPLPRPAPTPSPAVRAPPPPPCAGMDEEQCLATGRCSWSAICVDGPGSPEFPDAGVFACMREYQATRNCPEGCTFWSSCY
jgi:hypothetical protein